MKEIRLTQGEDYRGMIITSIAKGSTDGFLANIVKETKNEIMVEYINFYGKKVQLNIAK